MIHVLKIILIVNYSLVILYWGLKALAYGGNPLVTLIDEKSFFLKMLIPYFAVGSIVFNIIKMILRIE